MRDSAWSEKTGQFFHSDCTFSAADFSEPDDTLTRAILALPDSLRQVVVLRYYQGLTVQEGADVLHIHRRTVHCRLDKAERALRAALEITEPMLVEHPHLGKVTAEIAQMTALILAPGMEDTVTTMRTARCVN